MQDELDAYDRHQKELEEKLDEKTAALIHLQRVTMEHHASSPVKNSEVAEALGTWVGDEKGAEGPGMGMAIAPPRPQSQQQKIRQSSNGTVPSHLLITFKQYKPYSDRRVVFLGETQDAEQSSAAGNNTNPIRSGSPQQLLSADEKIVELEEIVTG